MSKQSMITETLGQSLALLSIVSLFVSFTEGCGKKDNVDSRGPTSPATVAAQLQTTFKSADPLIRNQANVAAEAIRRTDYASAINVLEKMRAEPHLTFEQDAIVKNALAFLRRAPGEPNH